MNLLFHLFAIAAALCYVAAGLLYLRALWRRGEMNTSVAKNLLLVGLFAHCCFFISDIILAKNFGITVNFFDLPHLLSSFALLLLAIFAALSRRLRIESLGAFLVPIGAALMICAGLLSHFGYQTTPPGDIGWLLSSHVITVVIATVLFFFSFAVSAAIILQETLLKQKRLFAFQQKLPALHRLDDLNDRLIGVGFLLMTIGTGLGFAFAFIRGLSDFWFDPLALWSELTVGVYAVLLLARLFLNWRGRRAAWFSVAGFCTIVAALVTVSLLNGSAHVF